MNQTDQHPGPAGLDLREALYNDRATGPAHDVQIPAERITRLHGILFDLDPSLLTPGNPIFPPAENPEDFHQGIRPVLDRHPLARSAEVRSSGTGLHLIVWLAPAVELHSAADQEHWNHIVRAVQCTLPTDPDCPGITALTRPVGSVNSKNGARVEVLQAGELLDPRHVQEFMARLVQSPFREVALPLLGAERVHPCPVCRDERTWLDLGDHRGFCEGFCKVTVRRLFNLIRRPVEATPVRSGKAAAAEAGGRTRLKKSQIGPLLQERQNARLRAAESRSGVELN